MRLKSCFTVALIAAALMAGCGSMTEDWVPQEALETDAQLATVTKTERMLRTLPRAKTLIPVSVYEFADLSGQTKPADTPQYSKAVTQGGLPILKKALLDVSNHGWFNVLERGSLNALLQERKIVRAMREEYSGGATPQALGPMLYAGLMLEGGIVSYESNVMTGGTGARYLGIGGSTKYSRDMVTVYLSAVSVKTGEVLLSVNTSKTIYSRGISGGMYKFVSYDEIVEAETGLTFNEPPQLAVRQAIELAVYSMIMEGYKQGLWEFESGAAGTAVFDAYSGRYATSKRMTSPEAPKEAEPVKEEPRSSETAGPDFSSTAVIKESTAAQEQIAQVPVQGDLKREEKKDEKREEKVAEASKAKAPLRSEFPTEEGVVKEAINSIPDTGVSPKVPQSFALERDGRIRVLAEECDLRLGPSRRESILRRAKQGDLLKVKMKSGNWYMVEQQGVSLWLEAEKLAYAR